MAKSILHNKDERTCFLCIVLHQDYKMKHTQEHHVIFGKGRRQQSEKYGLKVYLCLNHHLEGPEAVHKNHEISEILQQAAQITFERVYPNHIFKDIFGKNYILEQREEKKVLTGLDGFIPIDTKTEEIKCQRKSY